MKMKWRLMAVLALVCACIMPSMTFATDLTGFSPSALITPLTTGGETGAVQDILADAVSYSVSESLLTTGEPLSSGGTTAPGIAISGPGDDDDDNDIADALAYSEPLSLYQRT